MVASELGRTAVLQNNCVDDVAAETRHAPPPRLVACTMSCDIGELCRELRHLPPLPQDFKRSSRRYYPARGLATQPAARENPATQLLRLLSPANPARLAIPQVRYLGRLYAAFRWAAGFGVVALLAILTPPVNRARLAFLVLWVVAYNAPTTVALSRADNRYVD